MKVILERRRPVKPSHRRNRRKASAILFLELAFG